MIKISYLGLEIAVKQNIVRLEVHVSYALSMKILNTIDDLFENGPDGFFTKGSFGVGEELTEVPVGAVLEQDA